MKSRTFGNFLYAGVGFGIHQTLAFLDPELVDIIGKRLSQFTVEQLGKVRTADRKNPLQVRQAQIFTELRFFLLKPGIYFFRIALAKDSVLVVIVIIHIILLVRQIPPVLKRIIQDNDFKE